MSKTLDQFLADMEPQEREAQNLEEQIKAGCGTRPNPPPFKFEWPNGGNAYEAAVKAHIDTLRAMVAELKPAPKAAATTSKPLTWTERAKANKATVAAEPATTTSGNTTNWTQRA